MPAYAICHRGAPGTRWRVLSWFVGKNPPALTRACGRSPDKASDKIGPGQVGAPESCAVIECRAPPRPGQVLEYNDATKGFDVVKDSGTAKPVS